MTVRSSQKGITLVEVLLATALTAVVVGGLSTAIFATVSATGRGSDETSALRDLQNAAHWISRDAQMASTTNLMEGGEAIDALTLEWTDCQASSHSCSYTLSGSELQRNYDGNVSTVARYVSTVEFSISGGVLTYSLESTPPGRWQVNRHMTGKVHLRPNG